MIDEESATAYKEIVKARYGQLTEEYRLAERVWRLQQPRGFRIGARRVWFWFLRLIRRPHPADVDLRRNVILCRAEERRSLEVWNPKAFRAVPDEDDS